MIDIDDKVNIFWEYIPSEIDLTVKHKPHNVGEAWELEREDGTKLCVLFFSKMVKVNT